MKPKTERQPGYYWVIRNDEYGIAKWETCLTGGCWYIAAREEQFDDADFDEINPIPITPDDRSLYMEFAEWVAENYSPQKLTFGISWYIEDAENTWVYPLEDDIHEFTTPALFDWWLKNVKTKNE